MVHPRDNTVLWWVLGVVTPMLVSAMAGLGLILYNGLREDSHQLRTEVNALTTRNIEQLKESARSMAIVEEHERRISRLEGMQSGMLDFDATILLADYTRRP